MKGFRAFLKWREAIAYDMTELIVTWIVFAVIFIVFGAIVSFFQNWQQTQYPTGVFDPTYLGFVNQYWLWLPFGMLMIGAVWGFMKAIKKRDLD